MIIYTSHCVGVTAFSFRTNSQALQILQSNSQTLLNLLKFNYVKAWQEPLPLDNTGYVSE